MHACACVFFLNILALHHASQNYSRFACIVPVLRKVHGFYTLISNPCLNDRHIPILLHSIWQVQP